MTHPRYADQPGCDFCNAERVIWIHFGRREPGTIVHRKLCVRCIGIVGIEVANGVVAELAATCVCAVRADRP
jgi:hypothetical protein